MEVIPQDAYLRYKPNSLIEVRKELNLHQPGAIDEVLNNFEEWISKQNHFTKKDYNRDFLERSVILAKGSLERAKRTLEKLSTVKTLLPQYYSVHDVKNLTGFSHFIMYALLPQIMENNYRMGVFKLVSNDLDAKVLLDLTRFVIMFSEYIKAHDYALGIGCVIDFRDIDVLSLALKIDLVELKQLVYIVTEGYGFRVNSIHILSSSKAIETILNLLKQVFSAKLADRFHVHRTVESLHEFLPQEVLPEDLGGGAKSVKAMFEDFCEVLAAETNVEYFKEAFRAGTNESLRQSDSYNNEVLGMPGSFRTLSVD